MFRVTIKKSDQDFNFDFDEWNDACNFAGDVILHGDSGITVQLSQHAMIKIKEETEDAEDE